MYGRWMPSRPSAGRLLFGVLVSFGVLATLLAATSCLMAAPGQSTPPVGSAVGPGQLNIVARVNGEMISREVLAQECLRHYGVQVLESMVNRQLIAEDCKRRGVVLDKGEIDAEINRMASRFNLSVEQWFKMLKQERGIKPAEYANDIVWSTLALRKLAGDRLQISDEELAAEFECQYGPAVRARLIVKADRQQAEQIRAEAAANPANFGNLAKDKSDDASAAVKGVIQPIRKHAGYKEIEQAAFTMKDGEVSPVIQVGNQFAVIKREQLVPGADVKLEQVRPRLEEILKDRKMRTAAHDVFSQLQQEAKIQNVFNDPVLSKQMPGVAATINGTPISLRDLAEECIERHGEEVLLGTINRKLLEQAAKKAKVTVTEADLDAEIARAAASTLKLKADGSPNVEAWLKMVTEQQHISVEVYRHDSVWPSVALKKLVGTDVQVTEEDLRRGFEANYGPRVRCRAIVVNNPRMAQRVWELARRDLSPETFGRLAAQYSIEPGSRANEGEVPPIKKWGGQPVLEREAFTLKPGELSSIIQADDKFVILLCEGFTEPIGVDFASVRDVLIEDIREKKLRLSMSNYFDDLKEKATIDNFLAGTSQSPNRKGQPRFPPGTPLVPGPGKG
jgi:parvulin-like peptidyl-prolyl isomerase